METAKDAEGKEIEQAVFFDRPGEYARLENGAVKFPITKWSFRLIVLEKR
jgi:hypothetical protein